MAALAIPTSGPSSQIHRPCSPRIFFTLLNLDASSDLKRFSRCLGPSKVHSSPSLPLDSSPTSLRPDQSYSGQQLPPVTAFQTLSHPDMFVPAQQLQQHTQQQFSFAYASSQAHHVPSSTAMNNHNGSSNSGMHNMMQHTNPQNAYQYPNASWANPQAVSTYPIPRASTVPSPPPDTPLPVANVPDPVANDPTTWPTELRAMLERSHRFQDQTTSGVVYVVMQDIAGAYVDDSTELLETYASLYDANKCAGEHFITEYWGQEDDGNEPPKFKLSEDGCLKINAGGDEELRVKIYVEKQVQYDHIQHTPGPAALTSRVPTQDTSELLNPPGSPDKSTWPRQLRDLLYRSLRWDAPATPNVVYLVHHENNSNYMEDTNDVVDICSTLYGANVTAVQYFVENLLDAQIDTPEYELRDDGTLHMEVQTDGSLGGLESVYVRKQTVRAGR